jgi:DNA-binding NarL/FixJ family response regulator
LTGPADRTCHLPAVALLLPGAKGTSVSEPLSSQSTEEALRPIKVALIEDNRLVREGITALLNRLDDIQVIAAYDGVEDGRQPSNPDVILLDIGLANGDSLAVARKIREGFPDAGIVAMDLLPADEDLVEFIGMGVTGFVMKDANVQEVADTIRAVARGEDVLPPEMTGGLFSELAREAIRGGKGPQFDEVRLTGREKEVIDLIAEGLSNKAMGNRLHISVHTVKSHLRNIMEKLTLHSRLELAAFAHGRDTTLTDPTLTDPIDEDDRESSPPRATSF